MPALAFGLAAISWWIPPQPGAVREKRPRRGNARALGECSFFGPSPDRGLAIDENLRVAVAEALVDRRFDRVASMRRAHRPRAAVPCGAPVRSIGDRVERIRLADAVSVPRASPPLEARRCGALEERVRAFRAQASMPRATGESPLFHGSFAMR